MVMLYSSSMALVIKARGIAGDETLAGSRYLIMQMIWCGLGLLSAVTMAFVDYRILKRIWWILLGLALVLLVLVLVPHIGVVRGHARRWFSLGPASFQPSEFAKVAVLIALAWYAER